MNSYRIGFIGAGNMAKAIIKSMISNGYSPNDISIFSRTYENCKNINPDLNIKNFAGELVRSSDIVILAIKPQIYRNILLEIRTALNSTKTIVSIAAGITTNYIKSVVDTDCNVVRVMPNMPIILSEGATAIAENNDIDSNLFNEIKTIFSNSSVVEVVPEEKMDEITAVSGSSPAYIYLLTKAVLDYAVSVEIDYKVALNLFTQTLLGSAKMIKNNENISLDELINAVACPNGITLASLEILKEYNFEKTIVKAMEACTSRAKELSNINK